jgi:hypothetical protein
MLGRIITPPSKVAKDFPLQEVDGGDFVQALGPAMELDCRL